MGCLLIVPVAAAVAAMALDVGTFLGFLLAGFTAVITSLAALLGLEENMVEATRMGTARSLRCAEEGKRLWAV